MCPTAWRWCVRPVFPQRAQVDLKPASDVLAGAMARAASQSTIHPLDTLKVSARAQFFQDVQAALPCM